MDINYDLIISGFISYAIFVVIWREIKNIAEKDIASSISLTRSNNVDYTSYVINTLLLKKQDEVNASFGLLKIILYLIILFIVFFLILFGVDFMFRIFMVYVYRHTIYVAPTNDDSGMVDIMSSAAKDTELKNSVYSENLVSHIVREFKKKYFNEIIEALAILCMVIGIIFLIIYFFFKPMLRDKTPTMIIFNSIMYFTLIIIPIMVLIKYVVKIIKKKS
jgi:hypothetical protein